MSEPWLTKGELQEVARRMVESSCREQGLEVQITAAHVKLADLWHNLQPERQSCLPEKERKSLEARYLKARDRIWIALGHEWWPKPEAGR